MKINNDIGKWVFIALIAILAGGCAKTSTGDIHHISALNANELIRKNMDSSDFGIIDVRTSNEFNQGHIAGAILMDYYNPNFKRRLEKLDKSKTYLIYCTTGYRSSRMLMMIDDMGFNTIYHLQHGIVEWYGRRLPLVKS